MHQSANGRELVDGKRSGASDDAAHPPTTVRLFQEVKMAGGLAMVAFVHAKIWPQLQILLDPVIRDQAAKAAARETVRFYARLNLLLALPVTFAMLAAAHG